MTTSSPLDSPFLEPLLSKLSQANRYESVDFTVGDSGPGDLLSIGVFIKLFEGPVHMMLKNEAMFLTLSSKQIETVARQALCSQKVLLETVQSVKCVIEEHGANLAKILNHI